MGITGVRDVDTTMALFSYPLKYEDPVTVFASLRGLPYSLFFDSSLEDHSSSKYSYIAFTPLEIIETKSGRTSVTNRFEQFFLEKDPLEILNARIELYGTGTEYRQGLPPFQGGCAGMFGYDLSRKMGEIPERSKEDSDIPEMTIGIYNQIISFDLQKKAAWLIVQTDSKEEANLARRHLYRMLESSPGIPDLNIGETEWAQAMPKSLYIKKANRVLDYIRFGDIYQANLSQRFEAQLPRGFDSFAHYCNLRKVNPAPFSCYMDFGEIRISSTSPERFIKVLDRGVEAQPIKGTRPRNDDPHIDQLFRNQLENSEKDRAENAMIVDLMRNDVSKVCNDHSVSVSSFCEIESFASVHHLVSTVTGSLRVDKEPIDLLRACFPGGSITGCPKIRAMEIIEEMEPASRGPYGGAFGYIGFNGNMDTSIAIRTLVYNGNTVSFNVGGGIIAESSPEEEYKETMDKAEAIFRSFENVKDDDEMVPVRKLA